VIGDQATFHQRHDPPLMSDIAAVTRALDSRVASPQAADEVSAAVRAAVADACSAPGRISTVVMPADVSWSPAEVMAPALPARPPVAVAGQRIGEIAELARTGGNRVAMLLDGAADLVLADVHEDVMPPIRLGCASSTGSCRPRLRSEGSRLKGLVASPNFGLPGLSGGLLAAVPVPPSLVVTVGLRGRTPRWPWLATPQRRSGTRIASISAGSG
jgi:hypothetical protein